MFRTDKNKDERAIAVERASHSIALKVVGFALLLDVFFRSIVGKTAAWDLLGIVILGGLVATLYQARYRIATRYWVKAIALSFIGAALVAVSVIFLLGRVF